METLNTVMWIAEGSNVGPSLCQAFADLAIPVRANYPSEEVGMIGSEYSKFSGYYHVANSNVIVEVVDRKMEIDGISSRKGSRHSSAFICNTVHPL